MRTAIGTEADDSLVPGDGDDDGGDRDGGDRGGGDVEEVEMDAMDLFAGSVKRMVLLPTVYVGTKLTTNVKPQITTTPRNPRNQYQP